MRIGRLLLSFVLSVLFLIPSVAQQTTTQQGPQSVQRDAQAISILSQALNAAGGATRLGAIQDFTGTGTIAYNWANNQVPGSVTVYGKGLDQFRMDAGMSSGTQSFVVNGKA